MREAAGGAVESLAVGGGCGGGDFAFALCLAKKSAAREERLEAEMGAAWADEEVCPGRS